MARKINKSKAKPKKPQTLGERLSQQLVVGQRVIVKKENGEEIETIVTNYPWQNGHGDWVIGLEGFSVVYDITRVRPVDQGQTRSAQKTPRAQHADRFKRRGSV